MTGDFIGWGKIPRLFREVVITEKLDGTNGCLVIDDDGGFAVQSRNRHITPESDNHGFAQWAYDNQHNLIADLGVGYHFGEWWGLGIQRNYGLDHKRFSLFNPRHWGREFTVPQLDAVPILVEGMFSEWLVDHELRRLRIQGSVAAPGFANPEGIVIHHKQGNLRFKVTLEGDAVPKGGTR